jgi:lipoprotein
MKSTASRSPFQFSAIAVALASSLFALTACGGGGDSSATSGSAGSASGGATAVASNAQGSTAAGNSATNGSTQQGPGAAVSGTQEAPGAAGSATQQGQGTAGSVLEQGLFKHGQLGSMGPGKGSSNSESQAALWRGQGIGTEYARRIHATCPTLDVATEWGSKAYVPSILSCVAGSYVGTDLWTGQRCEVNIAANGDVRASRGGRAFRPFSASELGDYSWKDGAFRIKLSTEGRRVANSLDEEAESVALLFDPADALGARKLDRDGWTLLVGQLDEDGNRINEQRAREEWLDDPESSRLIQKMGDYLVVEVAHEAEVMSRDDMIWCAIPR